MSTTTITTTDGSVSLSVPASWQSFLDEQGVALTAVDDGPGFRTNAVLTYSRLPEGLSFNDWQRTTDQQLPTTLHDFTLLDLERLDVSGLPGARRLAHHASRANESLTMQQWMTVIGSTGITLTLTCATLRYVELAPTLSKVAASLEIHGEPTDPAPGHTPDGAAA